MAKIMFAMFVKWVKKKFEESCTKVWIKIRGWKREWARDGSLKFGKSAQIEAKGVRTKEQLIDFVTVSQVSGGRSVPREAPLSRLHP